MKKAFGILFLLIGLAMIGLGIVALTDATTRNNSFEGQISNEFSSSYRNDNSNQKMAGLALFIGGLFFFITGIVMVASKTNSQRRKEAELESIKKWAGDNSKQSTASNKDNINVDQLTKQAIQLYNQKDYHSAIIILQRILTTSPTNYQTHYNLACAYSSSHNSECFNSLSKAVEYGYMNFEKIKDHKDLDWLRKHPEYEDFLKNGYKLKAKETAEKPEVTSQNSSADNIYNQLEKLGKLKQTGVLTDEEFQQQKKKILR